jgi:hypothetical protein
MRWFRSNRVFGARAALFALIVQLTLAFGHVHELYTDDDAAAAVALSSAIDKEQPRAPTNHLPADAACAICATVHLTGSAQVSAPPALPVPFAYGATKLSLPPQIAVEYPRYFELRSRGPPLA